MADLEQYKREADRLAREAKREVRRAEWRSNMPTLITVSLAVAAISLFFAYVRANSAARNACKVVSAVAALVEDEKDDDNPALAQWARKQPYGNAQPGCERYAE